MLWFKDVTPLPHNGCGAPKRRRGKKLNIPSMLVGVGQKIEICEKSKKIHKFKEQLN